jgi:hypothetical protein
VQAAAEGRELGAAVVGEEGWCRSIGGGVGATAMGEGVGAAVIGGSSQFVL